MPLSTTQPWKSPTGSKACPAFETVPANDTQGLPTCAESAAELLTGSEDGVSV